MFWVQKLENLIKGEVTTDDQTLKHYSTDASIFEVRPKAVIFPKDAEDVRNLVKFASENKKKYPELSLTPRSGGTDMTGGPLGESIVVEFDRYFNNIKNIGKDSAVVQPGVYYRDFEKETLKHGLIFPSYPASKSICAIGGIVSNNAGGEKTLKYGKTNRYVRGLKVVLCDGNEYEFKRLNKIELQAKKAQGDFEGSIYRKVYQIVEDNFDIIQKAKPLVSKNSAGYYLWDVWDREYFDLTQLFVGSQGTLGLITEAELSLVKKRKHSRLVVVFLDEFAKMTDFVHTALKYDPESLETFDDNTLKLALRFLPDVAKKIGTANFFSLIFSFLGEGLAILKKLHLPKFIILVELTGDDENEISDRAKKLRDGLRPLGVYAKIARPGMDTEKYWVMRRESFNLLRDKVKDKRATPFIDDIIVDPEHLTEFLPKLYNILEEYGITPTLAGHAGSGNFHIIPLMDLSRESERAKIPVVSKKVYGLVLEYGGSITAEHNDGLIRSPYLEQMYGAEIYGLFKKVKEIFDPKNIFNPGKKVGADLDYAMRHIKIHNSP
ncbi:MAG: FAD-binding oxidoreductase [Candidatus Spechtbacterales bacterium]